MPAVKKLLLLSSISLYIIVVFILRIFLVFFPSSLRYKVITRTSQIVAFVAVRIFDVKVTVEGDKQLLASGGNFIVCNHLGYLDGIVLGSLAPVIYVSKSEVKSWPLFGWMAWVGGTIFVNRQKKTEVVDYCARVAKVLQAKVNVLVFPEGTSSNGEKLLDFQSIHFQAPLNAQRAILPLTIKYISINGKDVDRSNREMLCWYGQVGFARHLCEVLKLGKIEVTVKVHPKIEVSGLTISRKELSERVKEVIVQHYPLFN